MRSRRRAESGVGHEAAGTAADGRVLALAMIRRRARSRAEVVDRLRARGYPAGVAEAVAGELERAGVVDDRRLAESIIRMQMQAKPAGRPLLEAKLRRRGVPAEVAREAVQAALGGRDVLADAVDLARRRARRMAPGLEPGVVRRRVFAALARRGFEPEVCRRAVEAALGRSGGDSDE